MKKGLFFVGALVAISFASCKKDYKCKCSGTISGVSFDYTTTYTESTKKAAYAVCEGKGIGGVKDEDGNTVEDSGINCTIQ